MTTSQTKLATTLSKIAGVEVEITVTGLSSFTFSYEGESKMAFIKIDQYFKGQLRLEYNYDADCDYTCIYATK